MESSMAWSMEHQPVSVHFYIDISGSMEGESLDTVKASVKELLSLMNEDDSVSRVQEEVAGTNSSSNP